MSRNPIYRRVLLKLSGQGLMGEKAYGFDSGTMERIATEIRGVHDMGVQILLADRRRDVTPLALSTL